MPIVVSDSAAEESLQAYANPLSIQAKAISDLEDRVLNGDVVSDGNNVFTFLTEFSSNMVANIANKACACFNSLYPENAQTMTDLYKHLSDFDYIGLYSTPAEMTVELVFDRNFLIDNAVCTKCKIAHGQNNACPEGSNTYKIVLPEYSVFKIGEYTFGLMYPIEIKVRKAPLLPNGTTDYDNCVITVSWDTTRTNPLHAIESHILEHRDFIKDGQHLTAIQVPIYQFTVTSKREDAIASSGFARRYDYNDKFYAIRVFHWKNGQWNEMAQSLSDINYDADVPTAMIKVLADIGKVEVVVPQYYFNSLRESSRIGNRLLIKIYTCKGEINLDISEYSLDQFEATFLMTDAILVENDEFSSMLKRVPTIYIVPITSRISSGSDGITMEKLKERVKHDTSYTVKITPSDLNSYFETSGFKFTNPVDNITDRVFEAHKVLRDATGTTIAAGNGYSVMTPDMLNMVEGDAGTLVIPDYSDIVVLDSKSITIKPTAIYKYNVSENRFYMLSDSEKTELNNLTTINKVSRLNNNLYTYSPFHVRLSLDNELPIAGSYDLLKPSLRSIVFDWENENVSTQMAIYGAEVSVLNDDSAEGYRLSVALFKTENIAEVSAIEDEAIDIQNIHVMLSTTNSRGVYLYMLGTYNGKDASGHDVFIFDIATDFAITADDMIRSLSMYDETGDSSNNYLDIGEHKFSISFFIKEEFVTDYVLEGRYAMQDVDITGVPGRLDGYIYLCKQSFKMKFGSSLPLLQNNIIISATPQKYQTYPTTEFDTYLSPIYDRWTVFDYNEKVIDPLTNRPVEATKVNSLKLSPVYSLTTDDVFDGSKVYYTRSGTGTEIDPFVYTVAAVTEGEPVPPSTYYNRRVLPSIKHQIGDVIVSSQYAYTYGVAVTADEGDTRSSMVLNDPLTVTSKASNHWSSIEHDLYISGTANTRFVGVYSRVDRRVTGNARVWKQATTANIEIYDQTTIHAENTRLIYKYINSDGNVDYSIDLPFAEEYEVLSPTGDYYSSNSEIVKSDPYVASPANTMVNTKARDRNRKWFLMSDNSEDISSFKFSQFTGFVIQYSAVGTDVDGVIERWNLAFYYKAINAETGTHETRCIIVNDDIASSTDISDAEKTYLETDSYMSSTQEIYHALKFSDDESDYGWRLYETVDPNLNNALIPYYKALQIKSSTQEEPWDVEWSALTEDDVTVPNFTQLNTDGLSMQMEVREALSTIINYIQNNVQTNTPASYLNRYIDQGVLTTDTVAIAGKKYYSRERTTNKSYPYSYTRISIETGEAIPAGTYELTDKFIVDPLQGIIFTCVPNVEDNRNQEYCNSRINYAPGITDPEFSERAIEVGVESVYGYVLTTDTEFEYGKAYYKQNEDGSFSYAIVTEGETVPENTYYERDYTSGKGAIYYRDADASSINYEDYNISLDGMIDIISAWNKYSILSENRRYASVSKDTGVSVAILRKLVSDTEPCYLSPWKKLVNVSSFEGLKYYYENRTIVNCKISDLVAIQSTLKNGYATYATFAEAEDHAEHATTVEHIFITDIRDYSEYGAWASESLLGSSLLPVCAFAKIDPDEGMTCIVAGDDEDTLKNGILGFTTYSGYMYVIKSGGSTNDLSDAYYHYTSKIDRTYSETVGEDTVTTVRNEFDINFEDASWTEIDRWPWELSSKWMSVDTGLPSALNISFNQELSCARVKHLNTDVLTDGNGNPIIAEGGQRTESFEVDMLHCDYKLTLSDDADYVNYTDDVRDLLRSYFAELTTIAPQLLARTKMYFTPIRTFGNAEFKGSNNTDITLPLEFSISLGLHVESYVNGSDLNKDTIKSNILSLIDARLKDGYINLALLARDITNDLSDNIICVDVLGINGDHTLQTMLPSTEDCFPQLKQYLVLNDDGSVHTDRHLDITWYVIN